MAWKPTYATAQELATYLGINDTQDNVELGLAVESASRVIDHATNRQFGFLTTAVTRTFHAWWSQTRGLYVSDIDDLMTDTDLVVTVSGATVASSNYELTPLNAAADGVPWTRIGLTGVTPTSLGSGRPTVQIAARWGWIDPTDDSGATPDTIKNACLLQAARVNFRRRAPAGVAGSPDIGSEVRLLAKIDPDVAVMVQDYRRDHPMLVAG